MSTTNKPPIWFWVISVIGLIWNAMGVNAYLQQAYDTESYRAMYSEEQLEIAANFPAYITAAFAISVFAGLLGALFLIFRKKLATTFFYISLLGVIVLEGFVLIHAYVSSMVMTILIIVFALFFAWFAKFSASKGYLG